MALEFPKFRRTAAPTARRGCCRETYGYRGELRATGDVLRDQFMFLARSGFDSFEVKKDADAEVFAKEIARHTVFYQSTGDGRQPAAAERLRRGLSTAAGNNLAGNSSCKVVVPARSPAKTGRERSL